MIIILKLQAGIIYFKQIEPSTNNITLLFDKKIGNIYNKNSLSKITIFEKLKKKKILDVESNYLSSITAFKSKILLTYPYILHSKSKYIMPFMIEKSIQIFSNYNELSSLFINDGFYNFELIGLPLSGHDKTILKLQLSTLKENIILSIAKKIDCLIEINYDKNIPFVLLFNKFVRYNKSALTLIDKFEINLYFRLINSEDNIFLYFDNNQIIKKDKTDIEQFEAKLCEYYSFINEIYNLKDIIGEITFNLNNLSIINYSTENFEKENNFKENKIKEKNDKKLQDLNFLRENEKKIMNNINDNNNNIDYSYDLTHSKKKSSIKPFDPSEILLRNECKVDWGNNYISKTEIRKRNQNIRAIIIKANKELDNHYEQSLINNSFIEDNRKVNFEIHYDKDLVLSRINQQY